jgi:hypothetical protein
LRFFFGSLLGVLVGLSVVAACTETPSSFPPCIEGSPCPTIEAGADADGGLDSSVEAEDGAVEAEGGLDARGAIDGSEGAVDGSDGAVDGSDGAVDGNDGAIDGS